MSEINIDYINLRAENDPESLILDSEDEYRDFVTRVKDKVINDDKIRIILLAGPSGSGKTTTANLLADKMRADGLDSFVVSLDDFYRDATDPEYPRHGNGERDFESPYALSLPEIRKTLLDICQGMEFNLPHYDFTTGMRDEVKKHPKISHGCVIIEGLHALNPEISSALPKERVLKIFISVSTNITKDGERLLSGRKLRFVRRMVRDSLYRGADAERTLEMWSGVLLGEDKYLYPFRKEADIQFDTFHMFEPCVTRPFVLKLITNELAEKSGYANEVRLAALSAHPLPESLVPDDSLIREFIPGGIYEDIY